MEILNMPYLQVQTFVCATVTVDRKLQLYKAIAVNLATLQYKAISNVFKVVKYKACDVPYAI